MRFCRFSPGFRRASHNYLSATAAAFRAEIDDPVCNLDDIHIMFNAENGAAGVNELAEGREQLTDVVKVEAGSGFVENIECALARASALALLLFFRRSGVKALRASGGNKMCRQLHALRFATAQRCGRLPETQVAETNFFQDAHLVSDLGMSGEKLQRLPHREVQDFMNIFAFIADVEDLLLIARAFAIFAN